MSVTITMDGAGRVVLPKAVRDKLHLRAGARLKLDYVADALQLTPEPDENVRLRRKGKRLVITGIKAPFDAVAAVKAAREEYEERLARRVRAK
ncbi:MAG: AbrB/MazE/SpoVT family DNA-binding domain-containing protein [Verrucomicrobiota bacterium]|nr:AbrB/MazE/SpoVT family DNA-binding domain-containing protein [Verrucomicrobiota bacterium]